MENSFWNAEKNKFDLCSDWQHVSDKEWKQKIQFELKGADYNESLIYNSPEDIKVKPFYDQNDFVDNIGCDSSVSNFKIGQNIFVFDVEKSIIRSKDVVKRGAECLFFTINDVSLNVLKLLDKVADLKVPIHFEFGFLDVKYLEKIDAFCKDKKLQIYLNLDPIGQLAKDGNWFKTNNKSNFEDLKLLANFKNTTSFLSINIGLYQNAGANIIQQLAYGLGQLTEYLTVLPNTNCTIVFRVSVGSNYFFEIAKLRALRVLFRLLVTEYSLDINCHIIAVPSKRNKTIYDYNVNLLRTSTECMSAILGGADTVINLPYDSLYHKDNEFGDRIARNQLLIFKQESYFDKVNNPVDGSYYIESLTNELSEKVLKLFKEIEKSGGFLKKLNEGIIATKIQDCASKEQELFDSGKEILLGTNKYPNKNDSMKHDLELFPFVKIVPRKTLITPIIEKRLAESEEKKRLALE